MPKQATAKYNAARTIQHALSKERHEFWNINRFNGIYKDSIIRSSLKAKP